MGHDGRRGTVVHFLLNPGGGVWSVAKTLADCQRPAWRVVLVAVPKGPLRPALAETIREHFDAAHLARRPRVTGIYYLAPVNVDAAVAALGVDRTAGDVVYLFHTGPDTPWTYRLPRGPRPGKWLACFHGSRGNYHDVHNPVRRWLHCAGVRRLQEGRFTLVAVSGRSARDSAELYGCREADFRIAYNGVGQSRCGAVDRPRPHRPFHVGFVGTLIESKGWRKVVAAVGQLRREGMEAVCSVVGTGPGFLELSRWAAQRGEWLQAPGQVEDPAERVYPSLDALVLPSDFEGHALVLLEAMACGVPCICSDVGGGAETIRHDQEGYVLRENSAEEIAARLGQLVRDEALWRRFSSNCVARHAARFTAERMAAAWEELYLEGR